MKLDGILPFARSLLKKAIKEGDVAIDCTVGNGHDTVYLATLVGSTGKVIGFDIQETAIQQTTERLHANNLLERVALFKQGHEHMNKVIDQKYVGKIGGAIFNLGYLPGSDKTIVTKPKTTIAAIEQLLDIMATEGVIVLVIYHGHEEGAIERDILLQYVKKLDQQHVHVLQYQFINQKNCPPFIIAIEKR